jgi:hypothetical protein
MESSHVALEERGDGVLDCLRSPAISFRIKNVMPSTESVGNAYDSAMAERFITQDQAWTAVFGWLEGWCNPHLQKSDKVGMQLSIYESRLTLQDFLGIARAPGRLNKLISPIPPNCGTPAALLNPILINIV